MFLWGLASIGLAFHPLRREALLVEPGPEGLLWLGGAGDLPLDKLGCGPGVHRIADRTANHDVVGAVLEGLFDRDDPLLVIARAVLYRADTGSHHQEA